MQAPTIVTFNISTNLPLESGTYTVTVSGVKSSAGAEMAGTFTSTFSTPAAVSNPGNPGPCGPFNTALGLAIVPPCDQYWGLFSSTVSSGPLADIGGGVLDGHQWQHDRRFQRPADSGITVQFCPAYNSSYSTDVPACFDVAVVSTDASGNSPRSSLKFPRSGSWAGDFQLLYGTTVVAQTSFPPGSRGLNASVPVTAILETLQPETTL